jgi:hypothetical protein
MMKVQSSYNNVADCHRDRPQEDDMSHAMDFLLCSSLVIYYFVLY